MMFWVSAAAVIAGGYLFLSGGDDSTPSPSPADREPWTGPIWVPAGDGDVILVRDAVCTAGDKLGPSATAEQVAAECWRELQPGVPWPIVAKDSIPAQQVASLVFELAQAYVSASKAGLAASFCQAIPKPSPTPTPTPDGIGYDLAEWENNAYPTHGKFYQVREGDIIGGTDGDRSVIYRVLLGVGFLAATQIGGLDAEAARAWALSFAKNGQNRAVYRNLWYCSAYNDAYYTTYGFGENGLPGANGRAMRFLRMHADNRQRLSKGLTPIRTIELGKDGDQKSGTATGVGPAFEYPWMPMLDLVSVWEGVTPEEKIRPLEWGPTTLHPDPYPTIDPPPAILARINWASLPAGRWGCASTDTEVVVGG